MHARIVLGTLLLALSSCGEADNEGRRVAGLAEDVLRQGSQCETPILAKPEYGHLRTKAALGFDDGKPRMPTRAQLGDPEPINDEDVGASLDWYAETEDCGRAEIERLGQIDPELAMLYARVMQDRAVVVADIVKRRPTYGELNAWIARDKQSEEIAKTQTLHNIDFRLQARFAKLEPQPVAAAPSSLTGDVAPGRATTATTAVSTLASRQVALAQLQQNYAAATPAYRAAAPVTLTSCQWLGPTWTCQQF